MSGLYETVFGASPGAVGRAPARANLLGEHTDYNDGFVLPTPLAFHTTVEAGLGDRAADAGLGDRAADAGAATVTAHAAQFGATVTRRLDRPRQGDWMDYVVGCLSVLAERGSAIPPLRLAVASDVPMGAGVSSSAALEVAVLRAVRDLLDLDLDDRTLAQLGRRAENRYVGMQCGIMDQMVAALGVFGKALLLDTSDLTTRLIDLPDRHRIAIVHCGVAHKLTEVRPIPRLWIETAVLSPLGAGFVLFFLEPAGGALVTEPPGMRALMIGAGPVTALPLLWFASAARRLPLSTLGLFQYIAPTISLLIAVFLYDEPFTRAHVFAFVCIWLALGIYTWDSARS